jgi:hypothetical protein
MLLVIINCEKWVVFYLLITSKGLMAMDNVIAFEIDMPVGANVLKWNCALCRMRLRNAFQRFSADSK